MARDRGSMRLARLLEMGGVSCHVITWSKCKRGVSVVIRYSTLPVSIRNPKSAFVIIYHSLRPAADVRVACCSGQARVPHRKSEAVVPPTRGLVCHAHVTRAPAGFPLCVVPSIAALVPSPWVPSYARVSSWSPAVVQSELSVRYGVGHRTIITCSRSLLGGLRWQFLVVVSSFGCFPTWMCSNFSFLPCFVLRNWWMPLGESTFQRIKTAS